MSQIIQNAIKCPDGTYIRSLHNHHYVSHVDAVTGETYCVDGGFSYFRGSLNKIQAESYDLTERNTWAQICDRILIDVSPISEKENYIWKPLAEASKKEIQSSLKKLQSIFKGEYGWNVGISVAAMHYKLMNTQWK